MNEPLVLLEDRDATTTIVRLNRPRQRNALNIELIRSLCSHFEALNRAEEKRVVILHGAGPAFCAGLDLAEAADTQTVEQSGTVAQLFDVVTIAAVHGAGLMAACDFVVAAEKT